MDKRTFIIKGDICYSESLDEIKTFENHYLVCEGGKIQGVFPEIPEKFSGVPTENFEGQILFRETFHTPGTYYYRVSEVPEGGAYQ